VRVLRRGSEAGAHHSKSFLSLEVRKYMTASLLMAAVLFGIGMTVFWIEPLDVLNLLERLTPRIIYRIRTSDQLVALSFDDGPHPVFTRQVLQILERYDATATFFLIGDRALRHPEVVAQIKSGGHEVANHYFSDGSILGHSDAKFADCLQRTEVAIGITTGLKLFRPPGGVAQSRQLRLAQAHGYKCVLGCAYPRDPIHPPVWYIKWLIEKNLVPGTIVILHDGISDPTRGIRAPPHILEEGARRGLRFVSIGALMGKSAEKGDMP
jgi:peptidoglycan-N-acetylglucosamine deacetylase